MKIYVTRDIPESGLNTLRQTHQVIVNTEDKQLTKAQLIEAIQGVDAVISSLTDTIDGEVMDAAPSVKIFANYAVGFNNMDVDAAKERGVYLSNTPDVLSDTTAETAWSLLFAVSRRVVEADHYLRSGQWNSFSAKLLLGQDVYGKTLGIIGAGRIGHRFAEKSRGYHMPIVYFNRERDLDFEKRFNATYAPLEDLLGRADVVSLHVPLTEETHHLIGEKELGLMKKNAILINTSRGPVVDEKALVDALEGGTIWGAGLDVYENEPHVTPDLLTMKNVVLLPHIGSATVETRSRMSDMAARNVLLVLEGKKPANPVYE